ncbi:MAG: MFS transporter [Chroococcidiopsidaceae cyanobacterium CP_BM_ER_R8_30]|nr:MFS transporter [Chroococcidiopsidaceae cyanobacterium CP_BM_ER_R8_30]
MAVTSGAAAANLYYNQPLLVIIAQNFQVSAREVGLIPMLTQIGYAVGMLLLVPLGDLLERRRLILTMSGVTTIALLATAISPNLIWLSIASLMTGIATISAQLIIPFAAQLVKPQERGKVVGIIMGGLLIGILLARTVSGFMGARFGWRAVYWLASGITIVLAVALSRTLPKSKPSLRASYTGLMVSLFTLLREQPVLREASALGAMCFGAFSAFWSTLAFLLAQPPYHYGSEVTGLFGLVGVVGATAAPVVGRIADRRSPRLAVGLAIAITAASFVVFWLFGYQIWGLIIGVILLDLGVQANQVSNQVRIYRLPPEAHSRLNALYITFYFIGGALGSVLGTLGWSHWHWNGVCGTAGVMLLTACVVYLRGVKSKAET